MISKWNEKQKNGRGGKGWRGRPIRFLKYIGYVGSENNFVELAFVGHIEVSSSTEEGYQMTGTRT